ACAAGVFKLGRNIQASVSDFRLFIKQRYNNYGTSDLNTKTFNELFQQSKCLYKNLPKKADRMILKSLPSSAFCFNLRTKLLWFSAQTA
ncbi:MAG: hypothetical protein ACI4JR_01460, partial [Acutalibacteraceae bacterium]